MMQHLFHRHFSLSRVWQKRLLCLTMVGLLLFTMAGCQQPVTDFQPSSSQTGQTDPGITDPAPTNPAPTNPAPTNPAPTEPQPPATGLTGAIYNLTPGTTYKFGMIQHQIDRTVYYLTGYMEGSYMETTTDIDAAADVYIETTDGGFFIYVVTEGTKQYINMTDRDGRISCSYNSSASTVYTLHMGSGSDVAYNAGTPVATINGEKYCFGVRSDSPYTAMGPRRISESNYYGEFYGEVIAPGCDWILGTWKSVWRTDYETDSDLWVDEYSFGLGYGSLGGCGYTSWDFEKGAPGDHWDIAPMGYPSTNIGITFTGEQLTVTVIYEDFAEEDAEPYTSVYTVTRLKDGFITITDSRGQEHTYMLTSPDTTLEELCQALGVDYSLPSN